jgi:phospholipase/carboxylesterase
MPPLDRRTFMTTACAALSALALGCFVSRGGESVRRDGRSLERLHARGRLDTRPAAPTDPGAGFGTVPLGLGKGRDGVVHVPAGYRPERPSPLVVMLHGAGGSARRELLHLLDLADAYGLLLLAVDSRARTWDALLGGFGPDPAFIDRALSSVFARYAIDPRRVAVEGFSDGASYALGLGLTNGELFTHAIAFSPGMMPLRERHGTPAVFVAHGTRDEILPIDLCSRRIVPDLERQRYAVEYVEFDGPHAVPPTIAERAVRWFLS